MKAIELFGTHVRLENGGAAKPIDRDPEEARKFLAPPQLSLDAPHRGLRADFAAAAGG